MADSEELILLQSKCHVPRVGPDVLARERLFGQLDDWPSRRLTYVQGAPGFGKTMLASGWLQARREALAALGAQVSWISLDPQDNDPRLFLAYAAAALRPAVPVAAAAVEQNLRRTQFDLRRALTILLNGIAGRSAPLLLILDDYQHMADERIHRALGWMLEQGPANLHLMILSRQGPPPALGSFGTLAGVLVLDTEDLRFSKVEIDRYVEQFLGPVSDSDLSTLASLSGGWITGLKLAAFQLPRVGDIETYGALLHGRNQWIARYFVSEFLLHQPPLIQVFLLETSILDQLSTPLCTAVTGQADAGDLLQQAVDGGFFLRPIDGTGARFTYHDLFRELLAAELDRRCPPQQIAQLRQRAAVWLEANGEISAALRQYLAAGLTGDAVALLERHCLPTILRGDLDRARRWLAQLRDSGAEPSARLILDRGWLYSMADRGDTLQLLQATQAAWERLIAAEEVAEAMQFERSLQLAGAHHLAGNHQEALSRSAQLADRMTPGNLFISGLFHFLQMVLRVETLEEAREHGHKALAFFEEHGWISGATSVLRGLSLAACISGDAQDALRKGHQALQLAKIDRQDQTLEAIYVHHHLASLLYNLNRLDEAREQLREMVAKAELLGETHWVMWGRIMLALCDLAAESTASTVAANDVMSTGLDMANVSAILLDKLRETMVRFWLAAAKPDKAWNVARQYAVQFSNLTARLCSTEFNPLLERLFGSWPGLRGDRALSN